MIGDRFIPQQNTRNLNLLSQENKNTTIVQVPPLNMIVLKASGRRRRRRHNPYPPQGFTVVAGPLLNTRDEDAASHCQWSILCRSRGKATYSQSVLTFT